MLSGYCATLNIRSIKILRSNENDIFAQINSGINDLQKF